MPKFNIDKCFYDTLVSLKYEVVYTHNTSTAARNLANKFNGRRGKFYYFPVFDEVSGIFALLRCKRGT